jgi:hypothetical protein
MVLLHGTLWQNGRGWRISGPRAANRASEHSRDRMYMKTPWKMVGALVTIIVCGTKKDIGTLVQ